MFLETAVLNVQNTEPAYEVDFICSLLCYLFFSSAGQTINLSLYTKPPDDCEILCVLLFVSLFKFCLPPEWKFVL